MVKNAKVDNLVGMGGGVEWKNDKWRSVLDDNLLDINYLSLILWGVQNMFV